MIEFSLNFLTLRQHYLSISFLLKAYKTIAPKENCAVSLVKRTYFIRFCRQQDINFAPYLFYYKPLLHCEKIIDFPDAEMKLWKTNFERKWIWIGGEEKIYGFRLIKELIKNWAFQKIWNSINFISYNIKNISFSTKQKEVIKAFWYLQGTTLLFYRQPSLWKWIKDKTMGNRVILFSPVIVLNGFRLFWFLWTLRTCKQNC